MQRSKYIHRIIKAILFVAIVVFFTIILDNAFELNEGATENTLVAYSNKDDIDTVFVGNSAGEMLDAAEYSELMNVSAFNMCTPSQELAISLKNMKMAASHHKIKTVVLLMTIDSVGQSEGDWIDHLYDRVVDSSSPLKVRIVNAVRRNAAKSFDPDVIGTEKSINIWIPWENETEQDLSSIIENLENRFMRFISGERLGSHIAFDLNERFYENAPGEMTYEDIRLLNEDINNAASLSVPSDMIEAEKLSLLSEICVFCRDNDINLYVLVTPHRTDYYERYDSFRSYFNTLNAYIDDFIAKRGFMYYNTEDDDRLHQILPDDYFYDWEHVDDAYKDQATRYLSEVIKNEFE